jgi:hypothetical protein
MVEIVKALGFAGWEALSASISQNAAAVRANLKISSKLLQLAVTTPADKEND